MDHLFKPVQKVTIFQDIVCQIQEAIFTGTMKVGEKLPSEGALQKMFQTNRPAVREAIRIMEYQGLLHSRTGKKSGIYVKSRHPHTFGDNFTLLIRSQACSMNDLAEFREEIEGETVRIAASKCTDVDVFHLRTLIERAEAYSRKGHKSIRKFISADINFHLKLCEMAGNPLYKQILSALYGLNGYYKRFLNLENEKMKENLEDLNDIVSAFLNHQPEEAKKISKHHICKFNRSF